MAHEGGLHGRSESERFSKLNLTVSPGWVPGDAGALEAAVEMKWAGKGVDGENSLWPLRVLIFGDRLWPPNLIMLGTNLKENPIEAYFPVSSSCPSVWKCILEKWQPHFQSKQPTNNQQKTQKGLKSFCWTFWNRTLLSWASDLLAYISILFQASQVWGHPLRLTRLGAEFHGCCLVPASFTLQVQRVPQLPEKHLGLQKPGTTPFLVPRK